MNDLPVYDSAKRERELNAHSVIDANGVPAFCCNVCGGLLAISGGRPCDNPDEHRRSNGSQDSLRQ